MVLSDPHALENARASLGPLAERVTFEPDPYRAAEGAHAIGVMTDWALYGSLDYEKIYQSMVKPAFLFDGRNCLNHRQLFELGFNVFPVGKPALTHFERGDMAPSPETQKNL